MLSPRRLPPTGEDQSVLQHDEMDVQELLNIHYTHARAMEGATLYQKHDNFQKQTTNFQRLLQHAMNKFSKEKLNHMLKIVSRAAPYLESTKKYDKEHPQKISSLRELREIVQEIKEESEKKYGLQREDEVQLIKYFETYFDDLDYLKSLKKNFDEKIYVCLYDYFYDPADDVDGQYDISNRSKQELLRATHSEGDGDESTQKNISRMSNDSPVILERLSDREKLSYAVRELFNINQRWDQLFDESRVDPTYFDDDSYHELLQLKDYGNFEDVLRVVPDIFVKAHTSMELAKLWWTQANKVYKNLPAKRNSTVEFNKKASEMEKDIARLRSEIKRDEALLLALAAELEVLKERENKFNYLSDICEQMEEEKKGADERHQDILQKRDALRRKVKDERNRGSTHYKESEKSLRSYEREVVVSQNALDGLMYRLRILQSDYDCALHIRPDLIFFAADVSEKMGVLQEGLGEKKQATRKVEKRLVLLRTNCDRMRQIMRKYIRSVDVHDRRYRAQEGDRVEEEEEEEEQDDRYEDSPLPSPERTGEVGSQQRTPHRQTREGNDSPSQQDHSSLTDEDRTEVGKHNDHPTELRASEPIVMKDTSDDKPRVRPDRSRYREEAENSGIVMKARKYVHRDSRIPRPAHPKDQRAENPSDPVHSLSETRQEHSDVSDTSLREKNVTFTRDDRAHSVTSSGRTSGRDDIMVNRKDSGKTGHPSPTLEHPPGNRSSRTKDDQYYEDRHATHQSKSPPKAQQTNKQHSESARHEAYDSSATRERAKEEATSSGQSRNNHKALYKKNRHHMTNDSILNRKPFPRNAVRNANKKDDRTRAQENLNY